jgi:hypothetical protein
MVKLADKTLSPSKKQGKERPSLKTSSIFLASQKPGKAVYLT